MRKKEIMKKKKPIAYFVSCFPRISFSFWNGFIVKNMVLPASRQNVFVFFHLGVACCCGKLNIESFNENIIFLYECVAMDNTVGRCKMSRGNKDKTRIKVYNTNTVGKALGCKTNKKK